MSTGTKEAPEMAAETEQFLPPHLREKFERIDREIQRVHGIAPGVARLARLWLACGSGPQIQREFELAVLEVNGRTIEPHANGEFDEDCL